MTQDVNILVRGQSNAYVFVADGGASTLETALEQQLGGDVNVHILAQYGTSDSTIYSGTAFMDWTKDGEEQGLLTYLNEQSADIKDNPTLTLWMHNEYDQKNMDLTTADWVGAVEADASQVRAALGQSAETTPYEFVPIRYNYGGNFEAIGDGMAKLAADSSFNAGISWAAQNAVMDGDGQPNSSHMGAQDALNLAQSLATELAPTVKALAEGSPAPVGSDQGGSPTPSTPAAPTTPTSSDHGDSGGYTYPAANDWGAVGALVTAFHDANGWWASLDQIAAQGWTPNGAAPAAPGSASDGADTSTPPTTTTPTDTGSNESTSMADLDTSKFQTVWDESFDNGLGMLSRAWGNVDTSVPGQVTMTSYASDGYMVDSGAMVPPTGADAGYGYGLYSFTVKMDAGTAPGPYALLWPATDVWPGPELDLVESDGQGGVYSTIHYKAADGGNGFDTHPLNGLTTDGQIHTYSMDWEADHISVYVDGKLMYTTTQNVPKDYADGGENSAPGVGMQTWWSASSQHGDNHVTMYDVSYAAPVSGGGDVVIPTQPSEPTQPSDPSQPSEPTQPAAPAAYEIGTGASTLVLQVSENAWQGDAQFTVTVDGKQVGDVMTASALHSSGQSDTVTIHGDFAAGSHTVAVQFLNDDWDHSITDWSTPQANDRNLYLDGATIDGHAVSGAKLDLMSDSSANSFSFTADASTSQPTPPTGTDNNGGTTDNGSGTGTGGDSSGYTYPAADDWGAVSSLVTAFHDANGWWASFDQIVAEGWTPDGSKPSTTPTTPSDNGGGEPTPTAPSVDLTNLAHITGSTKADSLTIDHLNDAVIDGGKGADSIVLGDNHADLHIVFNQGQTQGDSITGFVGASHGGSDVLEFFGFAAGTTVTALGNGDFKVGNEAFHLDGVQTLAANDYVFH